MRFCAKHLSRSPAPDGSKVVGTFTQCIGEYLLGSIGHFTAPSLCRQQYLGSQGYLPPGLKRRRRWVSHYCDRNRVISISTTSPGRELLQPVRVRTAQTHSFRADTAPFAATGAVPFAICSIIPRRVTLRHCRRSFVPSRNCSVQLPVRPHR